MRWEYLVISARTSGMVRIYPPASFMAEMDWIKSKIPHTSMTDFPIIQEYAHFPREILMECKGKLKGMAGYVGWAIVQGMGDFGWEMFDVQLSDPAQCFPSAASVEHWTVFMRRRSEAAYHDPESPVNKLAGESPHSDTL